MTDSGNKLKKMVSVTVRKKAVNEIVKDLEKLPVPDFLLLMNAVNIVVNRYCDIGENKK